MILVGILGSGVIEFSRATVSRTCAMPNAQINGDGIKIVDERRE